MTRRLRDEMNEKLRLAQENVVDERTFLDFLTTLGADWEMEQELEAATLSSPYSSGALGWENGSIGAFIEASCAWAKASQSSQQLRHVPANPWRRVADILMAGKFYE